MFAGLLTTAVKWFVDMCRRGVSDVEMNASVEHFVTRCELACLMQELIGSYIMMEEYFMRQMVVKV